ncbi:hypothetical protein JCM10212_005765 [Sporobolomyces blumeae]
MKITINHYHGVALWNWNLKQPPHASLNTASLPRPDLDRDEDDHRLVEEPRDADQDEDDDEDDVCGICRVAFDGCCPDCKVPGDACPPIWGECTHVFHMHCLLKWLATESSKQQCPMDRRPWVTAGTTTAATNTSQTAPANSTRDQAGQSDVGMALAA